MAVIVKAGVPGIFYHKPSPEEPPYKNVGDPIVEGDVLGLIEVMKTYFEVKATSSGTVRAFLKEHGEAIMAGDSLLEIES